MNSYNNSNRYSVEDLDQYKAHVEGFRGQYPDIEKRLAIVRWEIQRDPRAGDDYPHLLGLKRRLLRQPDGCFEVIYRFSEWGRKIEFAAVYECMGLDK